MNLYLVRHGESTGNNQGLHQDSKTPLSEKGLQQAEELAKRFERIDLDICICSPFVRTRQTAEAILRRKNIEILYDDRIVETKRPTEIEGKSIHDPDVIKIKKEIEANKDKSEWYYSDEEKPSDIIARALSFIHDLEQRKEENVLVVTHGEFMRTMVLLFMYRDQADSSMWIHFKNFLWVSNTAITVLRRLGDSDPYTVNGWKLITWNDSAHLG